MLALCLVLGMASFAAAEEPLTKPAIITVAVLKGVGVLLTLIPSLIIFLLFQKQVYAGLASGSVKG